MNKSTIWPAALTVGILTLGGLGLGTAAIASTGGASSTAIPSSTNSSQTTDNPSSTAPARADSPTSASSSFPSSTNSSSPTTTSPASPTQPAVSSPAVSTTPTSETYVAALWLIPGGDSAHSFDQPQILVGYRVIDVLDVREGKAALHHLFRCGEAYQIDIYLNDETTAALLKVGVLTGPNNPTEHLALPASYEVFTTKDCEVTPSPTPTPTKTATPPVPPTTPPTTSPSPTPSPSSAPPKPVSTKPAASPSPQPTHVASLGKPSATATTVARTSGDLAYTGTNEIILHLAGLVGLMLIVLGIVLIVTRQAARHEAKLRRK